MGGEAASSSDMHIGVPDADLKFDAIEPQQRVESSDDVEPAPPPTPVHGGDLDLPDDVVVEEPAQLDGQAQDEEMDLGVVDGTCAVQLTIARGVYPRTLAPSEPLREKTDSAVVAEPAAEARTVDSVGQNTLRQP